MQSSSSAKAATLITSSSKTNSVGAGANTPSTTTPSIGVHKKSTVIINSSSSSNNNNNNNNNTKYINPNKPSSMKSQKSPQTSGGSTASILSNGTSSSSSSSSSSSRDLQTSLEIEEISKKISEHADALYRTWKSHGIAPTEILELYTAEAAAAAAVTGAITEDVKSPEGLHKLVNSFVIKDKEQRGVKTSGKTGSTLKMGSSKLEQSPGLKSPSQVMEMKKSIIGQNSSTKSSTPAYMLNNSPSKTTTRVAGLDISEVDSPGNKISSGVKVNKIKSPLNTGGNKTTFNKTSITTPFSSACATSPSSSLSSSVNSMSSKSMDFNLNLDINLDLNLDVQALTLQQSENLQKIKELLKQDIATTAAAVSGTGRATKIPSVIVEKTPAKSIANSSSSLGDKSPTKTKVIKKSNVADNGKKVSGSLEENKQNEEIKVQKKMANAATNDSQEATQQIRKIANKLKSTNTNTTTPITATTTTTTATTSLQKSRPDNDVQGQVEEEINQTLRVIGSKLKKSDKDRDRDNSNAETTIVATVSGVKKRTANATAAAGSITSGRSGSNNNNNNNSVDAIGNTATSSNILLNGTADLRSLENHNASEKLVKQLVEPLEEVIKKTATTKSKSPKASKEKIKDSTASSVTKNSGKTRDTASPSKDPVATTAAVTALSEVVSRNNSGGTMLTPSKLKSSRPLSNGQDKNSRSPFLTRGSVAERVLMFEKCPDARISFLNIKRPDPSDAPPKSLLKAKLHSTPPPPVEHNSLQKEIRSTKSVYIPRFYFPHGKPQPTIALERTLRNILSAFDKFPNNQVTREELPQILKICGLPFYWRMPVMVFCQQGNSGLVERQRFVEFWKQMNVYCHDEASRFVYILSRGQRMRAYILPEDLAPLVQDVVDTHPGLAFLKEATEFHSRYVHTVIARIFYNVNRSWSGRISISELKKSDLLEIISLLEEEDDINQIMAFFSYEHFYVIYCKFWELDKDHDLLISQDDLARHSDHALSTRIVERIFSGCVTRNDNKKTPDDEPKMSYTDFVWFLLSEEDKRTPTAIEYWFRCMDVDGDGVLSMYELEYFYEEQQQRMESIGIESLPFEDCLCQMLDMIKPKRRDAITLSDLKNCKMTHVFFDTFFNLEKYLDHEQRDPFATQRDEYTSDWDRFAAQEYELLITEEND